MRQPHTPVQLFASSSKRTLILCLLLVTCTLVVYNAVNQNGFVNYDDDVYVTSNRHVQAGLRITTIQWAFTSFDAANWPSGSVRLESYTSIRPGICGFDDPSPRSKTSS